MRNFEIFDTTGYEDENRLFEEGNKLFESLYIDSNLLLKGMKVSFSPGSKDEKGMYEKFKHLASMGKDESGKKYDSYPCQNDYNTCDNDCSDGFIENFKEGKTSRMYCPFRLSRIIWVRIVIELFNNGDKRVRCIEKDETKGGRFETTIKLWFQENKIDYLIILKKRGDKIFYITSYPIVMKRLREDLKLELKKYRKKE